MATKTKTAVRRAKTAKRKLPAPGRKMSKLEAREYVFKTFGKAMSLLAKH
ncbi:MAG TPA: hypothetical protein VFC78_25285 [Tepidisphaeraceae bacterium]|nr:hypothetical protein [Tepidisphaeraceae bacterium]